MTHILIKLLQMGSSRPIVSSSVSPAWPVAGDQDHEAALATLDSLEADKTLTFVLPIVSQLPTQELAA